MRRVALRRRFGVLTAAVLAVGTIAAAGVPADAASANTVKNVCGTPKPGFARCFAQIRTDVHEPANVAHTGAPAPAGYGPADLRSAYNLPTTGGANQTIAIVDAGDDPTAESDLAVYRSTYGLPPCTTSNGCFTKVNQRGAATPLPDDAGWAVEIALDLETVSAACPQCKILLAEADQPAIPDLGASVDTAVRLGATEVSNSYGTWESSLTPRDAAHYTHPGVAIVAASGDSGFFGVPNEPAAFSSVIAVGGTSLTRASNPRGWSETAWGDGAQGAASGCSGWVDKPAWQSDPNCSGRMVADVAADADPQTGLAVYDTTDGLGGWIVVGGTSASSPFIAAVIALAGNPAQYGDASAFYKPGARSGLYDVISGSTVVFQDCGGDYQCTAVAGYGGPTGMGTPDGISAF